MFKPYTLACSETMEVSGWSNSTPNDHTGAGYGILQHDDRHFQRNQVKVVLDNGEVAEVSLSKTFWTTSLNSRVSGDGC